MTAVVNACGIWYITDEMVDFRHGGSEYEKVSVLERPGTGDRIFSCVVVIWQLELVEYIDLVRRIVSCVYGINRLRI